MKKNTPPDWNIGFHLRCWRRFGTAFQHDQNTIVKIIQFYVFFIFSEIQTTNNVNFVLNIGVVTYAYVILPCGVSLIGYPTTVYLHVTCKTNVRKVARNAVLMYSLIFAQKTGGEQFDAGVLRTRTGKKLWNYTSWREKHVHQTKRK